MKNCIICNKIIEPTGSGHDYQRKFCGKSCKDKKQTIRRSKLLEMREYKRLWARNHYSDILAWQKANPDKIKHYRAVSHTRDHGYPEEFAVIKYQIRARDKNTCRDCGEKDRTKLAVHHIDKNKMNSNYDNLITVCRKCHGLRHRKEFLMIRQPSYHPM